MGSLISPPKPPSSRKQVVYVPTPPAPTPQPVSDTPPVSNETEKQENEVPDTDSRKENLLRRSRGRFGTVITGFRGLLSSSQNQNQRKTLLGE